MSCFEGAVRGSGLEWIRCSGGVALPGADPKTAATGLAPKQTAPSPQSNRAIRCPFWGFWFCGQICFGEAPEQRSSDILSAKIAGPLLPGAPFAFGRGIGAQLRALDTSVAWRREGPDPTEKPFIQSLLRLGLPVGHEGLTAVVLGVGNPGSGGAQRRTRT